MQAGARAACASPPLSSSPIILFSFRRALMFLFEKRASPVTVTSHTFLFSGLARPLPRINPLHLDNQLSLTRSKRPPSP